VVCDLDSGAVRAVASEDRHHRSDVQHSHGPDAPGPRITRLHKSLRSSSEELQAILSPFRVNGFRKEKERSDPRRFETTVALFILSIPFMLLAVAIAVVPLLVASHSEHRRLKVGGASRGLDSATPGSVGQKG
jgi:hypothetical protein